ncbi:MAG: ABC transporter ATP-binding protein [Desulfobulbaceae bacterium]|nr:ABC transporter ATP-binding protein [Desulfobulbaceae bacterium]
MCSQPEKLARLTAIPGEAWREDLPHVSISVRDLAKIYQIYERPQDRLKQSLIPRLQQILGHTPRQYFREFWALKDISFQVRQGETVGIIGRNGSGKSTLLQLICGTLNPTVGAINTHGRIAALLELGSGFNPEFTGRENVFLYGAVLGLTSAEIAGRFSVIEKFADLGDFIDQPIKIYSSGMVVRLAFSVAINVEPQILVIDEALSVGDELFQRKCFARIEAIKKSGATILFVSHSGAAIVELCDRALLLDGGELLASGAPKEIVGKYQKLLFASPDKAAAIRHDIRTTPGPGLFARPRPEGIAALADRNAREDLGTEAEEFFDPHLKPQSTINYESLGAVIDNPQIFNLAGSRVNCLVHGKRYRYVYLVRFTREAAQVRFGMLIKTLSGVALGGAASVADNDRERPSFTANSQVRVEMNFHCSLNPGTYFLNAGVMGMVNGAEIHLHRILDACVFRVLPTANSLATGAVDFNCVPDVAVVPKS